LKSKIIPKSLYKFKIKDYQIKDNTRFFIWDKIKIYNLHIFTDIQNLFCRKVILLIMKILNVNVTLPKSSTNIYISTLIFCLFNRDFTPLIFWTRDLALYIYIYIMPIYMYKIYIIYYTHIFAREVKWILPDKSQHFRFFSPVICLGLFIAESYFLWIQRSCL
jgi:hypothetical protein